MFKTDLEAAATEHMSTVVDSIRGTLRGERSDLPRFSAAV